jgi:hypothetical protein
MLIDSQGCRNIAIVLVLFVERVRVSLDLSFVEKLAKTQDFFCTPPVLGSVHVDQYSINISTVRTYLASS